MTSKKRNEILKTDEFLEHIADKAQVLEGKEIIRAALREIFKKGTIGTKSLARKLFLPIPTVAALRKELEQEGIISRVKQGAILTEKGLKFVTKELGINFHEDLSCKICDGTSIETPNNINDLLANLREYMNLRPQPLTELDQAYGKPITAMRRALLMLQNGDLENREVLLLGDDDFTSLAIAILNVQAQITVIDIDDRLLDVIKKIANKENYKIRCIKADLRKPIPEELVKKFDTIITDPPYTKSGLTLFLSRATQAIKNEKSKKIYLAFAHREPNETKAIQQIILDHGLIIQNLLPGFNLYEGAEMFGNTTMLMVLETTDNIEIQISNDFLEEFYTGELNPTKRIYECGQGHEIVIGKTEKIKTIEELKEKGCPTCKDKTKFTKIRTIRM
ncbi:MAG: putative methyltransferase [Asgard group archaeon]|nr:putative methyltransferase [Asgard group archaeon]